MVLLKHDGGYITSYAHADTITVQRGDVVERGQTIATVGSTGTVVDPQLHFQIRQGKKAIDPTSFLQQARG